MEHSNSEAQSTTSQGNDKSSQAPDHVKTKKRSFLEDDFFSLSSSFDKKKRKHKRGSRETSSNSPVASEFKVKAEEPTRVEPEPKMNEASPESAEKLVIVPPSEAVSNTTPAVATKSLATPPFIDKESILREIEKKVSEREAKMSTPVLDESDEEEVELEIVRSSPKTKNSAKSTIPSHSYTFAETEEKKRRYVIKITSKLPAPSDSTIEVDLGCKGMKSFGKILKSAVDFYRNTYSNQLPPVLLDRYNIEECALVWVEGKILVHTFFTPRMLRIPPPGGDFNALVDKVETMPPTIIHLFLIPKDNSENFMNVYPELRASAIEPEVKEVKETEEPTVTEELSHSSSEEEDELEDEEPSSNGAELVHPVSNEEGLFSIGLKGKDNKRISCKVSPETKLERLLFFYLGKKGIDKSTINLSSVKMIFDDEELNLQDTVADTELEEDFEIQIVL
ncbi:ESC2 [Candida metapsilosis]|uniref:ESC2 n=1 Tax=Candida metapsilosis TaxID=273372 RepID=A0A8H7ZFL9_9ASCO|nr:ESC2 [Candida metapsilosis]